MIRTGATIRAYYRQVIRPETLNFCFKASRISGARFGLRLLRLDFCFEGSWGGGAGGGGLSDAAACCYGCKKYYQRYVLLPTIVILYRLSQPIANSISFRTLGTYMTKSDVSMSIYPSVQSFWLLWNSQFLCLALSLSLPIARVLKSEIHTYLYLTLVLYLYLLLSLSLCISIYLFI